MARHCSYCGVLGVPIFCAQIDRYQPLVGLGSSRIGLRLHWGAEAGKLFGSQLKAVSIRGTHLIGAFCDYPDLQHAMGGGPVLISLQFLLLDQGERVDIQSKTLRTFAGKTGPDASNSNFSPSTGRAIVHYLCKREPRRNPYPKVAKWGPEIERLLHLPEADLVRLGLRREAVLPAILEDILAS